MASVSGGNERSHKKCQRLGRLAGGPKRPNRAGRRFSAIHGQSLEHEFPGKPNVARTIQVGASGASPRNAVPEKFLFRSPCTGSRWIRTVASSNPNHVRLHTRDVDVREQV